MKSLCLKIALLFGLSTYCFEGNAQHAYQNDEAPFFHTEKLFNGRGGRSMVAAKDGSMLAFNGGAIRKSTDGGTTWQNAMDIGEAANGTNAILNEATGEILLFSPKGYVLKSKDHGNTWEREDVEILPDAFGLGSPDHVPVIVWASQAGVTLMHGKEKGRLLMPGRI